jgi:hypothetical protein
MSAQQKLPHFIHGQPSMGLPFEKELSFIAQLSYLSQRYF